MAEKLIRVGRVSSVNYSAGTIRVTYPDLDNSVTAEFPVFSMCDEYKMPGVGQEVIVLHLSNGASAGVVMGRYWNDNNAPSESGEGVFHKELGEQFGESTMHYESGSLAFKDSSGTFSVSTIIKILKRLDDIEKRLEEVEAKV